jgi:hypothetical protein
MQIGNWKGGLGWVNHFLHCPWQSERIWEPEVRCLVSLSFAFCLVAIRAPLPIKTDLEHQLVICHLRVKSAGAKDKPVRKAPWGGRTWHKGPVPGMESGDPVQRLCDIGHSTQPLWALDALLCQSSLITPDGLFQESKKVTVKKQFGIFFFFDVGVGVGRDSLVY